MKKVIKNNELVLTESKTMREAYISKIDVLDKIKAIPYLTNDLIVSVEQVANYYEVTKKAINTLIDRHRDELEEDGIIVLKGDELKEFKEKLTDLHGEDQLPIGKRTANLTILTKRAMLRIGMLLTTSFVAKKVRNYLLNIEQIATQEQKEWSIQREVGKIDRKRMTTAIKDYIPENPKKRFAYPNYTNMIYKILLNKTAKQLREEKGIKTNDLLRDSFNKNELKSVQEAETIVTALVTLGFGYKYIEEQLKKKFN
ncbi:TPA: hypothetical protein PTV31_003212 [Clostridium botulinum]|nr:hypothetical protein [Clostridium botulinum]